MASLLTFDVETSRRIEATYTTPDVVEQRRVVRVALAPAAGERLLDIGSGPGLLAAELAVAVGPTGRVCGVDPSGSMRALAEARAVPPGAAPLEFVEADANRLPYPDGSFDAAVSTQVFEYVEDVPGALAEARRVLRPGGRLLLLDTDWDTVVWRSGDDARTARVLAAFRPHLTDPHLPRTLAGTLRQAGFTVEQVRVVPMLNVGWDEHTYSAGLLAIVAAYVTGRDGVTAADAEAWAEDLRSLDAEYFFSLNRYLFVATSRD